MMKKHDQHPSDRNSCLELPFGAFDNPDMQKSLAVTRN